MSSRTWLNVSRKNLRYLSTVLYDFTNKEHDMIMRCFRIGNYTSLRDLPNKLAANQLLKANKKRVEQTLQVKEP